MYLSKQRITNRNQFNILSWSFGWLTPDTAKQTARTADRFEPAFERASAITCSNVSLAALSVIIKQKKVYEEILIKFQFLRIVCLF